MILQTSGGGDILAKIPQDKNYDNAEVFFNPTCSIRVRLNVINQYSSNDTLFIPDYNNISTKLKVPGPFVSGELYTATDFDIIVSNYQNRPMDIWNKINNGNWIIKDFLLNPCVLSEIVVDIN